MRRALISVLACAAVAAGCGSGGKSSSSPSASSSTSGSAGSSGATPAGGPYDATSATFDQRIAAALKRYAEGRGITNVNVTCSGVSPPRASCKLSGTKNGHAGSATVTISVNQQNGQQRIVSVS